MKKHALLPLVMAGLFALAACGTDEGDILTSVSIDESGNSHIVTTKIINVWVHKSESEDEGKIYKAIMDRFNEAGVTTASGDQVRMTMEFLGTNIENRISAALVTGGLPDILAVDSSEEAARTIRKRLHDTVNAQLRSAKLVAKILGYEDERGEDSIMTPLGLRTLSRVPVVRDGMADKIVDEYGSLQEVLEAVDDDPSRLGEIGVKNPDVLANSLHRMWGKGE